MDKFQPAAIRSLRKDSMKLLLGEEKGNNFLSALPSATNERRNAFLHNKYDRTSSWLIEMSKLAPENLRLQGAENLQFNFQEDIIVATEFISKFGLANNPNLLIIFKALHLAEEDERFKMPYSIAKFGLKSKEDLFEQYSEVQAYLVDQESLTDISVLSDFQLILLSSATGCDTHSFSRSESINDIAERFKAEISSGEVAPLSPEYSIDNISFSDVEITYKPSGAAEEKFQTFVDMTSEVFQELESGEYWKKILLSFGELLDKKRQQLESIIEKMPDGKEVFMQRQLDQVNQEIEKLSEVNSIDQALQTIGAFSADKQLQGPWSLLVQKLVLYKMIDVGGAYGKLQSLASCIKLTPKVLLTTINIYDEVIKHHVINFSGEDGTAYWNEATCEFFNDSKMKKQMKKIKEIFQSTVRVFKEDVGKFEKGILDTTTAIDVIPDKGLIGEMSGYIANACYTNEKSMLANWPVTPYKFVDRSKTPAELIGTALVFEITLKTGKKALLVRAINVPNEDDYNIEIFCELFLDSTAEVAKNIGAQFVVVPGLAGAISNYQMTVSHIVSNYRDGHKPVSLSEEFNFNNYNLTDSCFIAREIE